MDLPVAPTQGWTLFKSGNSHHCKEKEEKSTEMISHCDSTVFRGACFVRLDCVEMLNEPQEIAGCFQNKTPITVCEKKANSQNNWFRFFSLD